MLIERVIEQLSSRSTTEIIVFVTLMVLLSSVPTVYLMSLLFCVKYTAFLLSISIILPLLLAPTTILILIKLTRHLDYYKEHLEQEIIKNKRSDLILFEQARFVLMGEMMANISHQWKQPLNTIGLSVVAARTTQNFDKKTDKYFDIIEDNVRYLAITIDDFMSFFDKKTATEIRAIEDIVKEIKSIVGTQIENKKINLEILIDSSHGKIEVASSISQVVLNLINNAKDAFEEDSKERQIKVLFRSSDYGLEIECYDNGKGIEEEIADKIFNPYFTTKKKSQGTGIGLHMSKEIVQKFFNGHISLNSRKISRSTLYPIDCSGKTCFYIALPRSSKCVIKDVLN